MYIEYYREKYMLYILYIEFETYTYYDLDSVSDIGRLFCSPGLTPCDLCTCAVVTFKEGHMNYS